MKKTWIYLANIAGWILATPVVWAQSAGDTASTTMTSVGRTLADAGVKPTLKLFDEFAGAAAGGVKQGTRDSGSLLYGADFDLNRLVGLTGGEIHAIINQTFGRSLNNDLTKNSVSFQAKYKPYRVDRLATLTYEQKLFDGVVDFVGGREPALTAFNTSPLFLQFQSNTVWPNPSVVPIQDKGLTFYPYATWAGRVRVKTSEKTYVMVGAYEANLTLQPSDGYNWETKTGTGGEFPLEIGYRNTLADTTMPTNVRAGFWYNTSSYTDPYYNTKGKAKVLSGGAALTHVGKSAFYLSGDQVVYRPNPNETRNLALFAGMQAATDDAEVIRRQFHAGLVFTGPFDSRPNDTIAFVGNLLQLGKREKDFLQDSRHKFGGSAGVSSNEYISELNYGVQITPSINIRPNIQYVIHPDTILAPTTKFQPDNIFVIGCRLSVDLDQMIGLTGRN